MIISLLSNLDNDGKVSFEIFLFKTSLPSAFYIIFHLFNLLSVILSFSYSKRVGKERGKANPSAFWDYFRSMLFENGSIIFHSFTLGPSEMTVSQLTQKAEIHAKKP